MKRKFLIGSFVILALTCCSVASHAQRVLAVDGGNGYKTEVRVYDDDIVRVVKYPAGLAQMPEKESFSVVLEPVEKKYAVSGRTVETECMKVVVNPSGEVSFYAKDGELLLKEGGCEVTPITSGVDKGFYQSSQTFVLERDEALFGLGQRGDIDMNQRGKEVKIWSTNGNITIPYVTSEKGYGVYWDNAGLSYFKDQTGRNYGTTFMSEVSSGVDYYFMYKDGTQDGVMAAVRQLSGEATMFPLWTLGFWQCRERYKSSDELCEVLDKHRELGIPLDGIVQDWQYWGCDSNWNAMKFLNPRYINKLGDPEYMRYLPDGEDKNARFAEPRIKSPQEMVDYVHKNNAHLMISIWASFGPWTEQYAELDKINALYPFDTWPRGRGVKPYDAFNPKARDIYWKYLKHLYDMDMDAWWSDSTEPDQFEQPGDMEHMTYKGSWKSVKNAFPLLTNIGIYEHQRKAKGGNDKRAFQMTRCGAFGLQRSAAFNWSGDITASWEVFKNQIPSGLNHTLCGNAFWNTDIGGFFYWEFEQTPKNPALAELQTRWMQWGTFMPLMRNHCSSPMISEIYLYGEEGHWAYDAMVDAVKLRYRILPYSYSQAGACVQNSETMMRPFVFDYAHDEKAIRLNDSYMYGHSFLVRPVTDPLYTYKDESGRGHLINPDIKKSAAPVSVYLPQGNDWYDFYTNERKQGGTTVQKLVPIHVMPVYVKAGSIIPLGPDVQYSSEKSWDNLEIRIYPGQDADFVLYEDEGDNYNYEQGAFSQIRFHWDDASYILTIGQRTGKFEGMLTERKFNVVLVDSQTPSGAAPAKGVEVVYDGTETQADFSSNLPVSKKVLTDTTKYEDVTAQYVANASFEADGTTLEKTAPQGWTVNSPTSWWGVNRGGTAGNPDATDGNYIFGVWDGSRMAAAISQTLQLPAGDYVLAADMHASNNASVRVGKQRIFAGENVAYFSHQINNPGKRDTAPMQTLTLPFTVQSAVPVTIGAATSDAPAETWFKVDNFRLYRKK